MVLAELTLQVSSRALWEGLFKERDAQQSLSPSPGNEQSEVGQDIFNVHKLHLKLSSAFPQLL